MGVDYRFPLNIRSYRIFVRPISVMETIQVASNVTEALQSQPESARHRLTENLFIARETLKVASTPEVGSKVQPAITDYVLERMTPDEIEYAFKQYVSACDKVNPALEELPEEQLKEIVETLKKNPSQAIEQSFLALVNVVRFLMTSAA